MKTDPKNFFEILPHTADIRLRAVGSDFKNLFTQALLGMMEILKKDGCSIASSLNIEKKIYLNAPSPEILLVDFLSEVLTFCYEEKAVFCRVDFFVLSEKEMSAMIFGRKVDGFDEDIKAVTYHQAKVMNTKDGFEALVLFDI